MDLVAICAARHRGDVDDVTEALATRVARAEGLPLPIPATNVFPAVELTDEADWRERVVRHLGLDEWARLEHHDELDVVGEFAEEVLSTRPFNAHFHAPLIRLAASGTLLTGIGGDELLQISDASRWGDILSGRARPERGMLFASASPSRRGRSSAG